MNFYDQREKAASEKLAAMLLLPLPEASDMLGIEGEFCPWDLFPVLYGSYSSDFDDLAIDVLTDVRDMTHNRTGLDAEMFREMLCTGGFCDYGSSPRACFPATSFRPLIGTLIDKWKQYRAIAWPELGL